MNENNKNDYSIPVIEASHVLRFEPKPEWFVRHANGIHGIGHITRVLLWTQLLAKMVEAEGMSVNNNVLGWAASIHDTQRLNDSVDENHGDRAADWITKNPQLLTSGIPAERVACLCRWHVPADSRIPDMTDELKVFKDADALDRWRIGDLEPAYLRTESAHRLLDTSRQLWEATLYLDDPRRIFTHVITKAVELGILI